MIQLTKLSRQSPWSVNPSPLNFATQQNMYLPSLMTVLPFAISNLRRSSTVCASNKTLPSAKRIRILEPHKLVGTTSNSNSVMTILTNRSMTGRWHPPPSANDIAHVYQHQILGENGYLCVSYRTLTRYFMETSLYSRDFIHTRCTFTVQSLWCIKMYLGTHCHSHCMPSRWHYQMT